MIDLLIVAVGGSLAMNVLAFWMIRRLSIRIDEMTAPAKTPAKDFIHVGGKPMEVIRTVDEMLKDKDIIR